MTKRGVRTWHLLVTALLLILMGAVPTWAQQDLSSAVERVSDSIFTLKVEGSNAGQTGVGAGFVVAFEGHALTCHHVVEGATKLTAALANGDEVSAEVVASDQGLDLALLKLARKNLPAVTFGSSKDLKSGADVAAIGAPLGLENSVTKGAVSNPSREIEGSQYIQISATLNPGNSGGPMVNSQGEVVGVANAILKDPEGEPTGVSFAIPSAVALEFLVRQQVEPAVSLGVELPQSTTPSEGAPVMRMPTPEPTPEVSPRALAVRLWPLLVGMLIVSILAAALVASIVARKALSRLPAAPSWPGATGPPPPPGTPPPPVDDLSDIDITLQ